MDINIEPYGFMRVSRLQLISTGFCLLILTGCAGISASESFDQVARQTRNRLGSEVQWHTDSAADARVQEKIDEALQYELSADQAVQIALLNNRELQAVYEEIGVSQAELVEAGLLKNPLFEGSYKDGLDGAPGPEVEATLLFDFLDLLFIPMKRSVAKADLAAAQWHVTGAVMDLASKVRRQFIIVQADGQIIGMLEQVVESTAASAEIAERLYAAGNVTDLDVANEQAMHARARLDLAQAEADALKNRERLIALMGVWGAPIDQVRIAPRLPGLPQNEVSPDQLEQRAIEASVDLEYERQTLRAAARHAGLTKFNSLLAELEAGGAWKREAAGDKLAGGAVSLPIPLFNWGQGRRARARAEMRRAADLYYAKAVEVRSAARIGWAALQAARDRARFSRDVMLSLGQRRLNQTQLQYNAMQTGPFELLDAKKDAIQAGRQSIEDLRDYWRARADMDLLLAGRIPETLRVDGASNVNRSDDDSMDRPKGR